MISIGWNDVTKHKPPQKTLLLVTGDSGYMVHDRFLTLAYIDEQYRPSFGDDLRWLDVCNDELTDMSWRPTHWAYTTIELPV